MYRHFRSKDDLLLAMADVMLEETVAAYVEGDAPLDNLRRMGWALRRAYLRRPGLARVVASRFTGGAAEAFCVRTMVRNIEDLGYEQEAAIARTRAFAELTLGHIIMTADVLALPRKAQTFELEMMRSYYTYPRQPIQRMSLEESRAAHLADGEVVYSTILETFLAGLVADAASAAAKAPLRSGRGTKPDRAVSGPRTRTSAAGKRAARA
jgi:AcrR family transcriptional regulator